MQAGARIAWCAAALAGAGAAQGGDVVVLEDGRELRGRVLRRYEPDAVMIRVQDDEHRIPRERIAEVVTRNDRLRTFLDSRRGAAGDLDAQWELVDWAESNHLPAMARLQALHVVIEDPGHEQAHARLGHRRHGGEWLWRHDGRWMPAALHARTVRRWNDAAELDSEHFSVRSDAGLRTAVDALLDLERLYVWWLDRFGAALRPQEVLRPMGFHVRADLEDFPPLSSSRRPYYQPPPFGDVAHTYRALGHERPVALFRLGLQQILHHGLLGGAAVLSTSSDRVAPWLELGLGEWVEDALDHGAAGFAEPEAPRIEASEAARVLAGRRRGAGSTLRLLLGRRYQAFHAVRDGVEDDWARAVTFVSFLMQDPQTRARALRFVDDAYRGGKGNSPTVLEDRLGRSIEDVERGWLAWCTARR